MIAQSKIDFELEYWLTADRAGHERRYRAILDMWGLTEADSILEIGTGPFSGVLPYVKARRKVGVDPLYRTYQEFGLFRADKGIEYAGVEFEGGATFTRELGPLHAIVTMNALDHGGSDFHAVERVGSMLEKGGRFYLHVHLRTSEQLNVGHDHCLTLEALHEALALANLRTVWEQDLDRDPIEFCEYRTVIGVYEK